MRPGLWPLWPELSRAAQLVQDLLLVTACVAAFLTAASGVHQRWHRLPANGQRLCLRWRVRHRAAHDFAEAVALADLDRAEAMAGRALGGCGRGERRDTRRTQSWDETVIMTGPRLDATAQLRGRGFAAWCHGLRPMRTPSGDTLFVVGRCCPLRLQVLSRRRLGEVGLRVTADARGALVVGQLIVHPGPASRQDDNGPAPVEVWVHVEGPAGWRTQLLLHRLRLITRRGLRRWAAERARLPQPDAARRFMRRRRSS